MNYELMNGDYLMIWQFDDEGYQLQRMEGKECAEVVK